MASILIIDDDPDVLDVLRAALEDERHAVQTALTNSEAQAIIHHGGLDLVICDAVLETAECQAVSRGVPLLVVSGDSEKVDRFRRAGVPALRKPFRPGALIAIVERLLREATGRAPWASP